MEAQVLAAEQRARLLIDGQLRDAGWCVQSRADLNLFAGQGVAVREVIMTAGHSRADYLLYVDQRSASSRPSRRERRYRAWSGSPRCTPRACRRRCASRR